MMNCTKGQSTNGVIAFSTSESLRNAGIEEIVLEASTLIFSLWDASKCCISFLIKKDSLSDITKKVRKELKNKLKPEFEEMAFRDIETQLIDKRDEIFSIKEQTENLEISMVTMEQSKVIDRIIKLRTKLKESKTSSEEWRKTLNEKYDQLKKLTEELLPELWLPLEFIISARMILKIKDWTLPFMAVILAVPSSLKTVALDLTIDYPQTFTTDEFTPASFVSHNSGMSEEELQKVDMLPRMVNNVCIFPELAPLFTAKDEDLSKNFGKIIRLLDGEGLQSDSGAQGHRGYSGKLVFVILGAAVEVPYRVQKLFGNLGQKIYFLRLPRIIKTDEERKEAAKQKNSIQNKISKIKEGLFDYLIWLDSAPESVAQIDKNGLLKFEWDLKKEDDTEQDTSLSYIVNVGNLLAHLRGVVNTYESKTRNGVNPSEQETGDKTKPSEFENDFSIIEESQRAIMHLKSLAMGHALTLGRNYITKDDISIVIKTALSSASIGRVRIFDFLLEKKGEVIRSEICQILKVSPHTAERIMTELDALELVHLSRVGSYNKAELRIKLKSEFAWFLSPEFDNLREGFRPADYTRLKYRLNSSSEQESVEECDKDDAGDSHTNEEDLPPLKETNNFGEYCPNDSNSSSNQNNATENNNLDDRHAGLTKNQDGNGAAKNLLTKINIPKRGKEKYTHVTLSHGHLETNSPVHEDDAVRQQVVKLTLDEIKAANSIASLPDTFRSIYNTNEFVKIYVNGKPTQRENKNVRRVFADVIRDDNIEVVKPRPQLLVRWRTGDVH